MNGAPRPNAAGPTRDVPTTEAVIFDFDGVIVESADIKTRAFIALYEEHGTAARAAAAAPHPGARKSAISTASTWASA